MSRIFADELSRIRSAILSERAERAGGIADGKFTTFDKYREEVGYVKGLDFTLATIARITGSQGED